LSVVSPGLRKKKNAQNVSDSSALSVNNNVEGKDSKFNHVSSPRGNLKIIKIRSTTPVRTDNLDASEDNLLTPMA